MFLFCCLFCFFTLLTVFVYFFFFQAEDGIRDRNVTGVQTCSSDLGMWANVAWSPDGARIVLDHAECPQCQDIGVMNEDGSGPVCLTHGPGRNFSRAWRP